MKSAQFYKRYLKERGFYSKLIEYVKVRYCHGKNERIESFFGKLTMGDFFYLTQCISRTYKLNWFYEDKTLSRFLHDYCSINISPWALIKTENNKRFFIKRVRYMLEDVIAFDGTSIKFIEIKEINGEKCSLADCWRFNDFFYEQKKLL